MLFPARFLVVHLDQLVQGGGKHDDDGREYEDQEPYEVDVISDSDAVVDPGAVVVESFDAAVACRAVTAARGTNHKAIRAKLDWVHNLHQFEEVHFFWLGDVAWVRELCPQP